MLTENSFQRLSDDIVLIAEDLTLSLLERISKIAEQIAENPQVEPNMDRITQEVASEWGFYMDEAEAWTDKNMPEAYLRGIQKTNGEVAGAGLTSEAGAFTALAMLTQRNTGSGDIPPVAKDILSEYPEHHTMYSVFQEQAYDDFRKTRLPVIRDVEDKVRRLTIEASETAYRENDVFTRRKMSQELLDRFADENITGIRYRDGRTMKLDSYSEMVARTQTGNAAREGSMRRQQEYGLDLVQISLHYPCSDLCIDYQGRVFSISGQSDEYPPLESAIAGGLYHPNCRHHQSAYVPGVSELPEQTTSNERNREMYERAQEQRYNERHIRAWKRRKASAITEDAQQKAQSKITEWQRRNKQLVEENNFLPRKYQRESITTEGRNI